MLRGHEAGTGGNDSFPRVTCLFLRTSSVAGTNFSRRDVRMKFNWFPKFERNESGTK